MQRRQQQRRKSGKGFFQSEETPLEIAQQSVHFRKQKRTSGGSGTVESRLRRQGRVVFLAGVFAAGLDRNQPENRVRNVDGHFRSCRKRQNVAHPVAHRRAEAPVGFRQLRPRSQNSLGIKLVLFVTDAAT